jgi:hypothetical protein
MNAADIEKITKVLEAMIQYELLLSDFYNHNADLWMDDHALWNNLALAEIRHADNIRKMKDIIVKKQECFAIGRPFNLNALDTVAAGLKETTRRLTLGEFSREKILIMARDIEQSIIESNYAEIVKTADTEYNTLMKDILSQTYEHKKIIQDKISEMKAKA